MERLERAVTDDGDRGGNERAKELLKLQEELDALSRSPNA